MNRTVAIVIAVLVLASAGWWGWTRPDLLPGTAPGETGPAVEETAPTPDETPPSGTETAATPPAETAPDTSSEAAGEPVAEAVAPVPTPAPRDAELPPETGSEAARETEAVAEAAITAADARARAEATARAERQAMAAAQAELRQALSPLLTATGFSSAAIRDTLAAMPAPTSPAVGQARARLGAEIAAILDEADAAAREAGSATTLTPPDDAQPAGEPAPTFRPDPFITRIEQLF